MLASVSGFPNQVYDEEEGDSGELISHSVPHDLIRNRATRLLVGGTGRQMLGLHCPVQASRHSLLHMREDVYEGRTWHMTPNIRPEF